MYIELWVIICVVLFIVLNVNNKKPFSISDGEIYTWAFIIGLFSFTFYGLILSVVIAAGALIRWSIQDKKDCTAREKEEEEAKIIANERAKLSAERQKLREERRLEAEINRARKSTHRLPKSSRLYSERTQV